DEVPVTGVDWGQRTAEELRAALELQKKRTPRIPIPSREKANKPSSQEPRPIDRNLWGAVTMGYQPALSASWSAATEAFCTEAALDERTARLTAGDWSDFSPDERVAYRFAHQLTAEPWSVTDEDVRKLTDAF